jgi:hypothetical protein
LTKACRACGAAELERLLDLGTQPVCHRYLRTGADQELLSPLSAAVCRACGLLQLDQAPPAESLRPIYDWIVQPEPEGHLDALVEELAKRFDPGALVLGATEKDEPLLTRLRSRGFSRARPLGPADAGQADLIITRYTLEHQHDIRAFLRSLSAALAKDGVISVEVPDSSRSMEQTDVSMLWEEHLAYFTEPTLTAALESNGLSQTHLGRFPYTQEDCLWALAKNGAGRSGPAGGDPGPARRFAAGIPAMREKVRAALGKAKRQGPVAFFGAGHRGCLYINAFDLGGLIDFVADDHPRKKGLLMPGSRLPILGSENLLSKGAKLCLLGINPDIERKVAAAQAEYAKAGGAFASICADSPYALVEAIK